MNRFYRLLAFGYFPKELPPIFKTRSFARHTFNLSSIESYIDNKWQRPSPFLLQQKAHYRRKLDIVSPQAILGQSHIIASNYNDLQALFNFFPGDCSRPAFNRKTKFRRAVRPFAIGKGYSHRKLELRSRFPVILKLDVKNYYRSIYTHSIPWAIHGKQYAKTNLREDNLGNSLDRSFRLGQDGQTIGIPTGPDSSFIIAEVILSRLVHEMITRNELRSGRIVRYYDDIEYGCESEVEAHRILSKFEGALREYELEINPDKVSIFSGPKAVEAPWLYKLRKFEWQVDQKTDELLEIFSYVSSLAESFPEDHIFRYFLQKMRTTIVREDAWPIYQRILLALFQENRGNAKEIFDQFTYYREIGWPINKKAMKEALDRKVHHQLSGVVTSDLSWTIYGYLLFDLRISKDLLRSVLKGGDCPSMVLATKIIYQNNISLKSEINSIVRLWGKDVLNSSEWLFAYEILANQWHNRYNSIELPDNCALYEHMRDNSVSFIDDEAMSQISLPPPFRRQIEDAEHEDELTEDWLSTVLVDEEDVDESDDEGDDDVADADWRYY
ncbi:MAG: RNA-directed DNA polymerase [Desulfobacteraceae bacterium]|jgi:hypothetical protein|nr:RNA-directed DNA polymerase [Desulfobacteraceae bacterium]